MTRLTSAEKWAIGVGLIIKMVVSLALVYAFSFSNLDNVHNLWNRWYTGQEDLSAWYIPFANWDGQHYLLLADWGYNSLEPDISKVFFPLYPLLIRLLSYVVSPAIAAIALGGVFIAGICYFLQRLSEYYACRGWHLVILMVMAFPTAFFFSVIYSESLFLFLLLGFVYHLLVTKSKKGLIYAALMPVTRGTALFVAVGLFAYMLVEYFGFRREVEKREQRKSPRSRRSRANKPLAEAKFDWDWYFLYFGAFSAGVLSYFAFFYYIDGDPFSGLLAQNMYVSDNKLSNILNPVHFVGYIFSESEQWFVPTNGLFDKVLVLVLLLCAVVFVAFKEWNLLCFYLPLIYCHPAMGTGMSFARYALMAVPFLALALAKHVERVWLLYGLCLAGFAFQWYLLVRFSLNLWAG